MKNVKMNKETALSLVKSADKDAAQYCNGLVEASEVALSYYEGQPFGDEIEGRSQLISTDVQDVIEDDMPNIVKALLSSENVMKFKPRNSNPKAAEEAKAKTDYINWLVKKQKNSYMTWFGWLKDALIQKISLVTYSMQDVESVREPTITGITLEEFRELESDLNADKDVKEWKLIGDPIDNQDGTFDITYRVKTERQEFKMVKVPFEDFRVSRYTGSNIDDAELVGHDEVVTRGELLAQGYDKELVSRLTTVSSEQKTNNNSDLKDIRFYDQDNGDSQDTNGGVIQDWANEEVVVHNRYVKLDYDGDGIAERRYFRYSGSEILDNEPYDHVPYAPLCAIPMPDKLIGRSRADLATQTQRAKSVLLRATMDNAMMVANPRLAVNDNVNYDDLLDVDFNAIIRNEGTANPGQNIFPIMTPYVGGENMQVMSMLDSQLAKRTGANTSNQGLNSDSLNQETATRFEGVESSGLRKVQLIIRNFAEGGITKLYEGAEWMARHHQNDEVEILVSGEPLTVRPSQWRHDCDIESDVGLAIADNEDSLSALSAMNNYQMVLKQQGSPLVDDSKIFNTSAKMVKASGLGRPLDYFNDPTEERQLTMFHNEQLNQMVIQLQEQMQMQTEEIKSLRALSEVEMIKAQAKAQADDKRALLDIAKLNQQTAKQQQDAALKLTELEVKAGQDLNAAQQDNMLVFDPAVGDFV